MISFAVLAARTKTPPSVVAKTFGPEVIHIPKAPALGLLLEQPRFGSYNEKLIGMAKTNPDITHGPVSYTALFFIFLYGERLAEPLFLPSSLPSLAAYLLYLVRSGFIRTFC